MRFECKKISINDEALGCQVIFSEKADAGIYPENMSLQEMIESRDKYLLLQRFYPEDEYDKDICYMETHDQDFSGHFKDYEMVLSKSKFELVMQKGHIEISINPKKKEFEDLKKILLLLSIAGGKLIINE